MFKKLLVPPPLPYTHTHTHTQNSVWGRERAETMNLISTKHQEGIKLVKK